MILIKSTIINFKFSALKASNKVFSKFQLVKKDGETLNMKVHIASEQDVESVCLLLMTITENPMVNSFG